MTERISINPRPWAWILALSLAAVSTALGGCAREDYYCDTTGCYYCDGVGCRPAQPPGRQPCTGGARCPSGQVCTNLGCAVPCRTNSDCPAGWVCRMAAGGDTGQGFCATPTEPVPMLPRCRTSADCGGGQVCIDGSCQVSSSPACTDDTQCANGWLCVSGRCTAPSNVCQFDNQCGSGRVCVNNECRLRCGAMTTCPDGQECVSAGSVMYCRNRTGPSCNRDADCGAGRRCIDAVCYQSCTPGSPATSCGPEMYCNDDGVCVPDTRPRPFCDATRPCQAGSDCVGGVCRVPCSTSAECQRVDVTYRNCGPIPYQNQTQRNYCLTDNEYRPVCARQSDCAMGQVCIDGVCR